MNNVNNNISLNINYPNTKYQTLNTEIDKILKKYINKFYQTDFKKEDFIYSLNINNQKYLYKNYISIIFFIDTFISNNHPNYYIETIVFNTKTNNFITIDDLINKNKIILNKLSLISYKYFFNLPAFKDKNIKEMLFLGTKPLKTNFNKFALSSDGLKIFFDRSQIAPYYYGSYDLVIPYNDLDLKM